MEPNTYYNEHGSENLPRQASSAFLIPFSIIIAGALVAFAVYYGGKGPGSQAVKTVTTPSTIDVPAVKDTDHIIGSKTAPVVIIEYSDTECPFCKAYHTTLHQLLSQYSGQVSWVYRQFPIASLHSKAPHEAEATECVAELKGNTAFWSYLDKIFNTTNSNDSLDPAQLPILASSVGVDTKAFNSCLNSGKYTDAIKKSIEEGYKAGVRGTPTSFITFATPLSDTKVKSLNNIADNNGLSSDNLIVSTDNKTVVIGGALPQEIMTQIIDTLIK